MCLATQGKKIMYDYLQIENKLKKVLLWLEIVLSRAEKAEVDDFINVGEYGLAFETLCFILQEKKKPISTEVYELLQDLGRQMLIEAEIWEVLEPS